VAEPACQPLTPRRATWLVLRRTAKRTDAESQQLTQLYAQSAEVAEAIDLVQDFATLVRQRQPAQFDPWLERAASRALEALQRFAHGLRDDYAAVKAGVTLPWSSGPVEGHINRLKMLKRQMFGRARLDLLSCRFVLAPRGGRAQAAGQPAPSQAHGEAEAASLRGPDRGGRGGLHREEPRNASRQRVWCSTPMIGGSGGCVHVWEALTVDSACLPCRYVLNILDLSRLHQNRT